MIIERKWAMPNKWTFLIPPIAKMLKEEINGNWIDPFCGENSPAKWKNDLNPEIAHVSHLDAIEFINIFAEGSCDGALYDPPYSTRQAAECYKKYGVERLKYSISNMKYWSTVKDLLAKVIRPGGKAICFGWNSMGLGINRGFIMEKILLVSHGGSRNDTICTIERKN